MERPVHGPRHMTKDEIELFLKRQRHGRLGLCDQGEPYVVPVAYGFSDGQIYLHSAKSGRKVDVMRRNSRVCFEVDEWRNGWASVICRGTAALRDDAEAQRKCFGLLMAGEEPREDVVRPSVYIGVIEVEEMTGRCSKDFEFD